MTLSEYRERARQSLKGKYWYCVAVYLLVTLVIGLVSGLGTLFERMDQGEGTAQTIAFVISFLGMLFVTYPFAVGLTRFFIKSINERRELDDLVFLYKNGLSRAIVTVLLKGIYLFLWTMLFIIPGIVKSYSYFLVEYLLAENPSLETKRVFEISKQAMDGYKMRAFLLELSFLGYIFLSLLTFGIGLLFLAPYMEMTMAIFYEDVKGSAIERGILSEEELIYRGN